jgi:hypothetical protein
VDRDAATGLRDHDRCLSGVAGMEYVPVVSSQLVRSVLQVFSVVMRDAVPVRRDKEKTEGMELNRTVAMVTLSLCS